MGALVAAGLILAWGSHLGWVLSRPWGSLPVWQLVAHIALQTWLHTGLFITAHDAMHGSLAPGRRGVNRALGAVAVGLYAMFSYEALRREHGRHHRLPASTEDPDWNDGENEGFARWYLRFMGHYLRWWQVAGMAVVFNVLGRLIGVDERALIACWVAPSLLSTLQLFYFGTWLPHREEAGRPFRDAHRARSNDYPTWASLVSCFHFGYHWEHHERPEVPWWGLPAVRRQGGGHRVPLDPV